MKIMNFGSNAGGAMALALLAGACGSGEVDGNAQAGMVQSSLAVPVAEPTRVALSRPSLAPAPSGELRCPAPLSADVPPPQGARILGAAPAGALPLSSATVTADAAATMPSDLSGLAEVEPEEGPEQPGLVTQYQDALPSDDAGYTLVCRYGAVQPPLLARSVLLLPIPARVGGYRCTTELPQGNDARPARAICKPM